MKRSDPLQPKRIVALIPARGGSKGVPRKNLHPLGGVPLIAHTILQAKESARVDRVVVTTDDLEIDQVARRYGAEVIERPRELADDEASSESALLHAIEFLEREDAYTPDLVVFLQCTSPLRTPADIDGAITKLEEANADALFSGTTLHGFVWQRTGESLSPMTYDAAARPRRQDIGEHVVENGSIYVFKPEILRQTGNRLGGRITEYPMAPLSIFQIDDPKDLELHERLLPLHPWRPKPQGLEDIRLLVLDFDGVLTDDRVWVSQDGTETVACHRGDGLGIEFLKRIGVDVAVLSKETNPVVRTRCHKLGIECHQGEDEKLETLRVIAASRGLAPPQIAYVGNDVNDLDCVRWAGWGVAVAGANHHLTTAADWTTQRHGGHGAVREVCDLILEAR